VSNLAPAAPASDSSGFTLVELMIAVAVIAILAALASAGLMRARLASNEASAISSVRTVNSAQASYAASCARGGYAQGLDDLSLEPDGGVPFITADLAEDGILKSGYRFSLDEGTDMTVVLAADGTCNGSAEDAVATYYVHGEPFLTGITGQRSFGSDHRGTIYQQGDGEEMGNTFASATPLR
jgi:type IV pilus assembly protein PilA